MGQLDFSNALFGIVEDGPIRDRGDAGYVLCERASVPNWENVTSRPEAFCSDFSATLWWIYPDHNPRYGFTPNCQNKNEYTSVNSSICLVTGLPAPWPAFVSILNKIGRSRLVAFFCSVC